ncbi:LysR family transcriptional regulator [Novosphingobium sp. G106]|uniref:LysR family transcriptional regulator n=1 Tax=Novosphingobium sp. G106 TaxID=2849500 RepID=UPI0020C20273|nr:LysR family transcriptional regulator [Novosphingobium sp. G106]
MLRYFLAVAETGNFSRAAKAVSVTQPTLSAGIAKLERQLGARLFDRDRQGVALTPAGSRFLARARRIAAEYELALQDLQHAPEPSVLRVGVLNTIPTSTVEHLLTRHGAAGSGEVLELLDGSERDLAERLDRGRIDLALTVIRPHHSRFRPELLARERYLMVLPQDHPLAEADVVEPEDLAGDRMVVRRHCEALPEIDRFFTARGVRPRFVLKTTSDQRVLAVVRASQGVGMMPESFADPMVRMVRVADFDLTRDIGVLYAAGSENAAHADSAFLTLLREHYRSQAV